VAAVKTHAANSLVMLVLNKMDLLSQEEMDQAESDYRALGSFAEVLHISAATGENLDALLDKLTGTLPESPPFYPPDQVTDQPERAIAAELVREQVLKYTYQEVPHAVAVVVDEYKERSDEMTYIAATVFVERESQKGIIIGAGGRMLKTVGQAARQELEALAGTRVYLDLRVKVRQDWRKKDPKLGQTGYT
jgi:GTPase